MIVERFSNQYQTVSHLFGVSAAELESSDERRGQPVLRWFAAEGDTAVAAVTAATRPDGRTIVSLVGASISFGPLVNAAADALESDLYASASDAQPRLRDSLRRLGFAPDLVSERFEIRFDVVLKALPRSRVPTRFELRSAADVDPEKLFALDNTIRNGVPGLDGWRENIDWFCAELHQPAAYLVAVDSTTGTYAGLARLWHNQGSAHFGLLGVDEPYRGLRLGPTLLRRVLEIGATWGFAAFTADIAVTNQHVHPRLERLGAHSISIDTRMLRPLHESEGA